MDLIHNQTFRLLEAGLGGAYPAGIYRVIFDEAALDKVVCVCLESSSACRARPGGRIKSSRTKKVRRKPPAKLIGEILWLDRPALQRALDERTAIPIEILHEAIYFPNLEPPKDQELYARRCKTMRPFLDFEKLKEGILVNQGLAGLVREAMITTGACRSYVYKLWSILCRLGISRLSLLPRRDRCGAPNVPRPCNPNGRKKAGAKDRDQRIARAYGKALEPLQPGMSDDWSIRILAADRTIKTPVKPDMPQRIALITKSAFVTQFRYEGNEFVGTPPALGTYPNRRQVRRVLETEVSRLERLIQRTTKGHFKRSLRGLRARNWRGVAGPGHTWAIDSTIGDMYLRSSINRAWIVGRPVVYIVVDVWSTAVVGFYVCLTGPSWNTAKVSIFNSVVDSALLGELWGYQPIISLNPEPTLCFMLLCDRGEYLSKAASLTAIKFALDLAYTPPYRPDLKGLVEVLHRIAKDAQFMFEPGAMDARRAEFELQKSHPSESVFTVREYTQYLHVLFNTYNLTANREKRVDAHMAAAGVYPSPAGLWNWGHAMGVGFQRAVSQEELITGLLPSQTARVGRTAVVLGKNDYDCNFAPADQWTAQARNFGGWNIPAFTYPGSVSRIWTPNTGGDGLLTFKISDQTRSDANLTFDEMQDALAQQQKQRAKTEHKNDIRGWEALARFEALRTNAARLTAEAIDKDRGTVPTVTQARLMEVATAQGSSGSESKTSEIARDEAMDAYEEMMRERLNEETAQEDV
jgi:putative transposase